MSAQSAIFNPSQTTSAATGDGFSTPRLTTTARLAITFTTADKGMMVYDTTLNNLFIWNGSAWESVPASGDSTDTQVIFNDNGILVGDSDLTFNSALNKLIATNIESSASLVVGTSATISGDLTVDTNVLKVDTSNNRVGINNASPTQALDVAGSVYLSTNATYLYGKTSGGLATRTFGINAANDVYVGSIDQSINNIRFNSGGGDWMTLNSTGLGVGGSVTTFGYNKGLTLVDPTSAALGIVCGSNGFNVGLTSSGGPVITATNSQSLSIVTGGSTSMVVNSSGNVGIANTPTAGWRAGARALQLGANRFVSIWEQTNGSSNIGFACYESGSNALSYTTTGDAPTLYSQISGTHKWYNAASGTAGNAITFTQAMTLDAAGYLLLGTTDTAFTSGAGYKFGPGATPSSGQVGASSSNADLTNRVYSTGAAAYRFYVGYGGTVFATNTTISAISDQRLKENVQDIDVGLGAILALKPRKFDWKSGKGKDIKGDRGFIAQEFEQVFPQLVDNWADPSPEGEAPYKSVRQDLIPVLVKAIQELAAEVNALKNV